MRLVLQRAVGDCGIAALCTLAELAYEDVYLVAARVDGARRGKSGATWKQIGQIAEALGFRTRLNMEPSLEDDRGLLAVRWKRGSPHRGPFREHTVALAHGVIADPADGLILPVDEYLLRAKARPTALLELI